MERLCYWDISAPEARSYRNQPLADQADIVVIGGGFTGLSTALHLAKKGASVALLESEILGWGASSRNGGQCNPGITISPETAVRRFGLDKARQLYKVSLDAVDYVEKLVNDEMIDCEFRRCGRLGLAYKPSHFENLRAKQILLKNKFGHDNVLIPPGSLGQELTSDFYHGGLLDPLGAALHPKKLINGLSVAAERAGVDLHEDVAACSINREADNSFMVATKQGNIKAKQVMLATNGYTGKIHLQMKRRLLPIGSFIIATEPLSESLVQEINPNGRNMVDTKNYPFFFRLSSDNRMLFGGRARFALSDPESDHKSGEVLKKGLVTVFPQLANVKVEYVWGGTVAFTLDRMPHAGEMDGVYFAMGYCGHGVQHAVHMGMCMAEVIDGHPEANPWRDINFPPVPYAAGWTWILPLAGAYYKVLDWVT